MGNTTAVVGFVLLVVGLFVTLTNIYLSWIRVPLLRRLRHSEVRWVSGIPLLGSLALWLAAACLPSGSLAIPLALVFSLFDTGGVHWFVASLAWRRLRRVA